MFYWKLTPHIVRYGHKGGVDRSTIHSVNERMFYLFNFLIEVSVVRTWADIGANDFVEMIRFFTTLILNADETTTF